MRTIVAVVVAVAGLWLAPSAARADWVPAPPCARCQLEGPGEYCVQHRVSGADLLGCQSDSANANPGASCNQTTSLEAQKACCSAWLAAGWRFQCHDQSWGAVWCRERKDGDPAYAECPTGGGCALGRTVVAGSAAATLVLALLALAGLLRRGRPRR